ncbi:thiamine phosphate synthase [Rhabdobacter roseus]|uniref:Thiamine-phosphate pyrophosphorylase n=1 Tax=Rhabdobacter roseus TaxID=1655419 RepID=A0A840TS03_9BACT|nr:thiamine phosphate synthase [Rhabdobacter roseus]MBB5282748.1 thiamine-phosphate pyrophosphorylase [Rhabdobacter roseus]
MTRLLVVSHPDEVPGEAQIWQALLERGLERLHVRKPGWTDAAVARLLDQVPEKYLSRVVVHHRAALVARYPLGGLHVGYRSLPKVPSGTLNDKKSTLSCSVHSWSEAEDALSSCDYLLLSPVWDSVSKPGYLQNAALREVPPALRGRPVFALGGITEHNVLETMRMGYFGVALLGYFWNEPLRAVERWEALLKILNTV